MPYPLQMEVLQPFEAVARHFQEQYRTLATALDTTRHELPVSAVHLEGDGRQLLGRAEGHDTHVPVCGAGTVGWASQAERPEAVGLGPSLPSAGRAEP